MATPEQYTAADRIYLTLIGKADDSHVVHGLRYEDIRAFAQVSNSELNAVMRAAKDSGNILVDKDERNWNVYRLSFAIDEVLAARAKAFVKGRQEVIRAEENAERDRQQRLAAQREAEHSRRLAQAAAAEKEWSAREFRYQNAAMNFAAETDLAVTNFEIYDRGESALKATFDLKVPGVGTFVRCTFMWPQSKDRGWVNGPSVQNRAGEYQKAGYLEKELSAKLLELCEFVLYGPSPDEFAPVPLADPS